MLFGLQKLERSPFVREGAQLLSYQQPQSKMFCLIAYQIPPKPCSFKEIGKVGLQKGQTLPWAFTPKSFCQKYKITSLGRIGKDFVEVGSTIVFF
jgi:hypothetical protein